MHKYVEKNYYTNIFKQLHCKTFVLYTFYVSILRALCIVSVNIFCHYVSPTYSVFA